MNYRLVRIILIVLSLILSMTLVIVLDNECCVEVQGDVADDGTYVVSYKSSLLFMTRSRFVVRDQNNHNKMIGKWANYGKLGLSPDGEMLAVHDDYNNLLQVFDVDTGDLFLEYHLPSQLDIYRVDDYQWSNDGSLLFIIDQGTDYEDSTFVRLKLDGTGFETYSCECWASSVAINPAGDQLAVLNSHENATGYFLEWQIVNVSDMGVVLEQRIWQEPDFISLSPLSWFNDGSFVSFVVQDSSRTVVFNLNGSEPSWTEQEIDLGEEISDFQWSPTDHIYLILTIDGLYLGYDGELHEILYSSSSARFDHAVWSPDGGSIGTIQGLFVYLYRLDTSNLVNLKTDAKSISYYKDQTFIVFHHKGCTVINTDGKIIDEKSNPFNLASTLLFFLISSLPLLGLSYLVQGIMDHSNIRYWVSMETFEKKGMFIVIGLELIAGILVGVSFLSLFFVIISNEDDMLLSFLVVAVLSGYPVYHFRKKWLAHIGYLRFNGQQIATGRIWIVFRVISVIIGLLISPILVFLMVNYMNN